jgi:hypothetical protein
MTAKTSDFSGLLYYNPAGPGFNAVEQVTIHCPASMDEGDSFTVNLVTWGIPDGTVLAHNFPLTNIGPLRFNISPISPVANNRASFFIAVNSDNTTASGAQSFNIQIKKTVTSDVLATKTVTVNDTSQTPSGPSYNQVISLNPNYIATYGGTSIPNDTDKGSTSATVAGTFTSSSAQGGTLTFNSGDSRILLPAKNIKTIGMWIKLINPGVHNPAYLLDSRLHDVFLAGSGSGYFYSGGIEDWTLMSINGAPADNSSWASLVSSVNVWQYVTVISQTTKTNSITLFNRYTPNESLVEFQVGRIEAWDYILVDSQIAAAYASYSSNYV